MLSSFTLISLTGVMLGVLVLVVVMAVYAGLERDVKDRLLGFTPHVLISQPPQGPGEPRMSDWRESAERAMAIPFVESTSAYISDNVIIDVESWQRPVQFRAIDAEDPSQTEGIARMLDHENHPGSSADLGIDDRVVISSILAEQLRIGVGETVRLYSTRNFEEVLAAYKATENPPVREAFRESWESAVTAFKDGWNERDGMHVIATDTFNEIHALLDGIRMEDIREPERQLIERILGEMDASEDDRENRLCIFTPESRETITATIGELETTDPEKMDGETLKGLRKIVLPREAEVIGIYLASQLAVTPDIFIPLPLAQALSGLDDGVQGIALRLRDPYLAEESARHARESLGPGWSAITWGDQYQAFFALINQQRVMMYFALSFIVLVSAFSMMAVMFTVTIQKRREIGVMKALGAAPGQIVRVFLYQGMLLGVLGAVLGVGCGRLVIHFRGPIQGIFRQLGFDPFSSSFTGFGVLPAHNNPVEQAAIGFMAFVLCSLAALVPAFFAARSDAAKSLRNL
jgi:lipoprotein-releasing system permease protein